MSRHFATPGGILCATTARWPVRSGDLSEVTCRRCTSRFNQIVDVESCARFERERLAAAEESCRKVGAGHLWDFVANGTTPTERLMRDLLGTICITFASDMALTYNAQKAV